MVIFIFHKAMDLRIRPRWVNVALMGGILLIVVFLEVKSVFFISFRRFIADFCFLCMRLLD